MEGVFGLRAIVACEGALGGVVASIAGLPDLKAAGVGLAVVLFRAAWPFASVGEL